MSMLPLTFMLPLIGFLILATMRDRLSENAAAVVGVGSMGLAALCALMAGSDFLMNHPQGAVINLNHYKLFEAHRNEIAFTPADDSGRRYNHLCDSPEAAKKLIDDILESYSDEKSVMIVK